MESFSKPIARVAKVEELVSMAREGRLRVPPFQRLFRWSGTDIERLFDSIARGYPIGSLLLWKHPAPAATIEFGPVHCEAPELDDALWVVDGQQRLTSLVGVLAAPPHPGVDFDLYYDASAQTFRRPGARSPRADWIPLRRIGDTNDFVDWLLEFRAQGASPEAVAAATELGNRIRDYPVSLSIVHDVDERVLRDIFDRMNTFGRRLRKAEVFQALHAAMGDSEPADLRGLVDEVRDLGFGAVVDDTVLHSVLAVRGEDVYRDFRDEFASDEDPAEAYAATAEALRRTIDFLQREARIPHQRALPYVYVIPVLARFFHLHRNPSPRTLVLLRRWVWRGAWAGVSGAGRPAAELRRMVQAVGTHEDESLQALIAQLPALADGLGGLDLDAYQLHRAAGRMNVALLAQLEPRDLRSGEPIDLPDLLEDGELLRMIGAAGKVDSLACVFLHPPLRDDEVADALAAASPETLGSHGLAAEDGARDRTTDEIVAARRARLETTLPQRLRALVEPDVGDRPSLAALTVPNDR